MVADSTGAYSRPWSCNGPLERGAARSGIREKGCPSRSRRKGLIRTLHRSARSPGRKINHNSSTNTPGSHRCNHIQRANRPRMAPHGIRHQCNSLSKS